MNKRILALALAAPLSACVMEPPPAAVVDYSAVDCRAAPNLASTIPLPLAAGKRTGETVRAPIDATTPCLEVAGAKGPYLVFAMPNSAQRMIEVGGAIEAYRVFPPAISILDENGRTLRTFARDQFLNRGDRYSVQFIPQEGERYILVTVDQSLVGTSYNAIATGMNTIYFGYGGYWNTGIDQNVSRSRSYEGAVLATVYDTTPR